MSWPTGQEYNDAIQTPRLAFEDADLQTGSIETDRLGLPRPRSGNFAVVYKLECGGRSWAVKCFTREVLDQQRRYAAVSAHLRSAAIPYTVGFEYLSRGIRVRGQWFPVLKMEWVSGDPLIRYIEAHLRDPGSVRNLASRWVAMVRTLRSAGIAHGDLQHGNVLVVGGDLRLVDYDGMFVPALAGAPAIEVGHPNYQHPGRAGLVFGPDLDNFSAWSIYVSLIALSIDPSMWARVKGGDDCLLFRASDLAQPERSEVFKALASSPDEGLRALGEVFDQLLHLSAEQIPPVEAGKIPIGPPATSSARAASWVDDFVKAGKDSREKQRSSVDQGESEVIDASWVLDFITPAVAAEDAKFVQGAVGLRVCGLSSVFLAVVALVTVPEQGVSLIVSAVLVAANVGVIVARYRTEPGVKALMKARASLSGSGSRAKAAAGRVAELNAKVIERTARRDKECAALGVRIREIEETAKRESDAVQRRLVNECAQTQKRRSKADVEEKASLSSIAKGTGVRVASVRTTLQSLAQEEATEAARALSELQNAHVFTMRSGTPIANAQIPGVGPHLKGLLIQRGIGSAQDVDRRKLYGISGFGPARVSAVLAWANGVEQRARASMPGSLPAGAAQTLRGKYDGRRLTLTSELQLLEGQERNEQATVKARFGGVRKEVDDLEAAPRAAAARDIRAIQERSAEAVAVVRRGQDEASKAAKADVDQLERRKADVKRTLLRLQWEKARCAAGVRAYASVTLPQYLKYVAFAFRKRS